MSCLRGAHRQQSGALGIRSLRRLAGLWLSCPTVNGMNFLRFYQGNRRKNLRSAWIVALRTRSGANGPLREGGSEAFYGKTDGRNEPRKCHWSSQLASPLPLTRRMAHGARRRVQSNFRFPNRTREINCSARLARRIGRNDRPFVRMARRESSAVL